MSRSFLILLLFSFFARPTSVWGQFQSDKVRVELEPPSAESPVLWKELKSYDGRFRLLCPGEMSRRIDTIDTKIGPMAYHVYFYQEPELSAENLFYMLSYCDYPEEAIQIDSAGFVEAFFQETMESAAFSINGELLYSGEADYRGHPGKVWRIDYLNGQAVIRTHAYLINNRYYALQTISLKEKSINESVEKFIDSFRLLTDDF